MTVGFIAGLLYQATSVLTKFTLQTGNSPYVSAHLLSLSPSGGASTSAPEGVVLEVTMGGLSVSLHRPASVVVGPLWRLI